MSTSDGKNRKCFEWTDKQKRAYQRIKSGIAIHQGEILRFLTLGSIPNMKRDQQEAFRVLKERIRRLTVEKLFQEGYVTKRQLKIQFKHKKPNESLTFDYIKIRTSEGPNGVLHILFFGDFLPQEWLKENWNDITGGCNSAYIKATKKRTYNEKRLSRYCISQYCVDQSDGGGQSDFLSYSWSPNWVYPGFVDDWEYFKSQFKGDKKSLYYYWNTWLRLLCKNWPLPTIQYDLDGGEL